MNADLILKLHITLTGYFYFPRLRCKCIKNLEPGMKKASRPVAATTKAAGGAKTQLAEKGKAEGAASNMGTGGKSTAKTATTGPLSKVQIPFFKVQPAM